MLRTSGAHRRAAGGGVMAALAVVPSPAVTAASLYMIEGHLAALIETAELVSAEQEQEFRAEFQAALTAAVDKRDRVGQFLAHLEQQIAFARFQIDRLRQRKATCERALVRLENYGIGTIEGLGTDSKGKYPRLEGKTTTFSLRACPPSVEVTDESAIPAEYRMLLLKLPAVTWEQLLNGLEIEERSAVLEQVNRPEVSVDKRSIKAVIDVELSACDAIEDKLREATGRIQGSLTCVLVRMDAPGSFWSFTKGSGQSLYAGVAGDTCILASEVYGCLELVRNYFPFAGETSGSQGHSMVCRVQFAAPAPQFTDISTVPAVNLEPRPRIAEITTRDVDRRGYRHYFRKELEEAIESVTQTIVGRYSRTPSSSEHAEAQFSTLYSGDAEEFIQKVASSTIRHFVFIGQGSAHVAGLAGAHFINEHGSPAGIRADPVTAGEFSAHWLRGDLSGTCIVAVSQSATTTDTNRAAKLARARGATVLGIVNRRDSTLAEISHLVIYTSDGRDVEMAVASTKAFYSDRKSTRLNSSHRCISYA